jgi:formylglycine-generating enzyme
VSEWVSDWDGGYPAGPVADPQGPTSGKKRVYRGSAWNDWPGNSDIANRGSAFPDFKIGSLGFRLIRIP